MPCTCAPTQVKRLALRGPLDRSLGVERDACRSCRFEGRPRRGRRSPCGASPAPPDSGAFDRLAGAFDDAAMDPKARTTPHSIAELVTARAQEAPGALALLALDGTAIDYAALAGQIERTRAELNAAGLGRGDRVALVLGNGPELAAAFLGIASGATCAPLNPAYREPEFTFYLSDLEAKALVVGGALPDSPAREAARRLGIPAIELATPGASGSLFSLEGRVGPASRSPTPGEDDVALVLHTSGTTSRPKAVPLTHANLCASARSVATSLGLTPADRCLCAMPLFHVHGLVAAILASVQAGASIVCAPGFDGVRFLDWLVELDPTWYTGVPTMHEAVLERARLNPDAIGRSRLRLIRSSSAALPAPVLEGLEQTFGCPVIEAYGMTEASHQMTSNRLSPAARKPGSVGPAAGPEVVVLDETGHVLPRGAVGEVAVRGPSVFRGYDHNPEANAEAFSDGWFRTGDEGAIDDDGHLFLRGRRKEIINRGGEKISPREVDDVLLAHPAIAQAVTFAQADRRLGETVAAAVVLREGTSISERDVQAFAAERLVDFKVPRTVVFVEELPTGATGKVQRLGLAELLGLPVFGADAPSGRPAYVPPRTPLEQGIAALWEELLGVENVGIDDDFFSLGGESLHAAELLARLETDLPVTTLLWAPTVGGLAAALDGERREEAAPNVFPVRPTGTGPPLFFVHTHGGEALPFVRVARGMRSAHPSYAFAAAGDGVEDDVSVEGLAARYLRQLRTVQPEGPYLIAGFCFGAAIALEMGRGLLEQGEEPALLALVLPIGEPRRRVGDAARRVRYHAKNGQLLTAVGRGVIRRVRRPFAPAASPAGDEARERFLSVMGAARDGYVATPYAGRIAVFRSRGYLTPDSFWSRIAGAGVDWYELADGAERDVFDPRGVGMLAARLDEAVARACS
jgi:oxalate---CoA ligase